MLKYNFDNLNPLGEPNCQVKIDETLMRGKRKYNVGRLLQGNLKAVEDSQVLSVVPSKSKKNRK